MSTKEAAAIMGISPRQVCNLIREGVVSAGHCASGWCIDPTALLTLDYVKGEHRSPRVDRPPTARYRRLLLKGSKEDAALLCNQIKNQTGAPAHYRCAKSGYMITTIADVAAIARLVQGWNDLGGAHLKALPYYVAQGLDSAGKWVGVNGINPDPRLIALCREKVKGQPCALPDQEDLFG